MNSKQRKVLAAIFAEPTAANIEWIAIENLLMAIGCHRGEASGSRVRFSHGSRVEIFHRPHPAKEAKRYQVERARAFLLVVGVHP